MGNNKPINLNTGLLSVTMLLVAAVAWYTREDVLTGRQNNNLLIEARTQLSTVVADVATLKGKESNQDHRIDVIEVDVGENTRRIGKVEEKVEGLQDASRKWPKSQ